MSSRKDYSDIQTAIPDYILDSLARSLAPKLQELLAQFPQPPENNPLAIGCQGCYTDGVDTSGSHEPQHLDNQIGLDYRPSSEGDTEMAQKINQSVIINGEKRWIRANSMQEFTNKVLALTASPQESAKHLFSAYAWNWYNTYSAPNVETSTATTYKRQLTRHLLPFFGKMAVEEITTDDVQQFFNGMTGAKTTKYKAKEVLNQVFDAAVEENIISKNPLKSKRLKITGKASKPTAPYSVEEMRYLVQHIGDVQNPVDRAYLALQALHPLRLEEVLGLHPENVDTEHTEIHVRRAVTHPTRN
jgi:hypothetical protein